MRSRSQRLRCCSASGTSSPPGLVRAGRRASVSSISASRPATSPSPGSSRYSHRASRIASADRSGLVSSSLWVAEYPSLKIRYSTCSTARSRSPRSASLSGPVAGGRASGTPLALMACLARLIRWAMVASGTRNAAAI